MDAAGVFAKPSTAQDTVSLSHQNRRCCAVSCAGRRGANWLGEKRGLSESSSLSFFSMCSRWNDGGRGRRERAEDGVASAARASGPSRRVACSRRRSFKFSLPPRSRRRRPFASRSLRPPPHLPSSRITLMAHQMSIGARLRFARSLSRFQLPGAFSIAGAPAVSGHDEWPPQCNARRALE
jgi:hypothetical protein